jgi:hypothetical protein
VTVTMSSYRHIAVDVADSLLVPASAATPTARCRKPLADKVDVRDLLLRASFAATSTLSTATAGGGESTRGVGVAACLLPPTSAPTPTPTVTFLAEETPMRGRGVGVPESMPSSVFAGTSTTLTPLVAGTAATGVAELLSATTFATTPVAGLEEDTRRRTRDEGDEEGE